MKIEIGGFFLKMSDKSCIIAGFSALDRIRLLQILKINFCNNLKMSLQEENHEFLMDINCNYLLEVWQILHPSNFWV